MALKRRINTYSIRPHLAYPATSNCTLHAKETSHRFVASFRATTIPGMAVFRFFSSSFPSRKKTSPRSGGFWEPRFTPAQSPSPSPRPNPTPQPMAPGLGGIVAHIPQSHAPLETHAPISVSLPSANRPCALSVGVAFCETSSVSKRSVSSAARAPRAGIETAMDAAARDPGLQVSCSSARPFSEPATDGSPRKTPPAIPAAPFAESLEKQNAGPRHFFNAAAPRAPAPISVAPLLVGFRVAPASWPSPPSITRRTQASCLRRTRYASFSSTKRGDAIWFCRFRFCDGSPGACVADSRITNPSPFANGVSTVVVALIKEPQFRGACRLPFSCVMSPPTENGSALASVTLDSTRALSPRRAARSVPTLRSRSAKRSRVDVISANASRVSRRRVSTSRWRAGGSSANPRDDIAETTHERGALWWWQETRGGVRPAANDRTK